MGLFSRKNRERGFKPEKQLYGEEKAEYQASRYAVNRQRSLDKLKETSSNAKNIFYNNSKTGKISSAVGRATRRNAFRSLTNQPGYRRPPMQQSSSTSFSVANAPRHTGRRGRPVGSYKSEYAAYGGVYNFRKEQNHRRALERMQALKNASINPQQQQILAQIAARERAQQMNPENAVIPDTRGEVRLKSIHQEIDDFSNLVP